MLLCTLAQRVADCYTISIDKGGHRWDVYKHYICLGRDEMEKGILINIST